MKRYRSLIVSLAAVAILAASCAPAAGPTAGLDKAGAAGFWKGLWHGFIIVFTFIVSLFKDGVGIYESHNNGNLYNLGFVLGVMFFFGGSGGGACRRR